jgi:hypothetical protein
MYGSRTHVQRVTYNEAVPRRSRYCIGRDPSTMPGVIRVREEPHLHAVADQSPPKRQRMNTVKEEQRGAVKEEHTETVKEEHTDTVKEEHTDTVKETTLHELLLEKDWSNVMTIVENLRKRAGNNRIPELDVLNEFDLTPLLHALDPFCAAPSPVVKILTDTYTVRQPHPEGDLPLHLVCDSKKTENTILKILNLYPEAILQDAVSQEGNAFHVILQHKPPLKLIDYMVQVWAKQSREDDDNSCWKRILSSRGPDGMLPLHVAVQNRAPNDVILKMIEKYPASVTAEITKNKLPTLHVAAFNGCSLEVLTALLKEAPGKIEYKAGDEKETPLHLLFHVDTKERWRQEKAGMLPRHDMARYLIKTHANHYLKNLIPKSRAPAVNPMDRAKRLVMNIKSNSKYTVLEMAKELRERLSPACPEGLRDLIEELESLGDDWECPLDGWPELNLF